MKSVIEYIPLSALRRGTSPRATVLTQGAGDKPLTRFRHYHENSTSDLRHSRESSPPRGGTESIFVARTLDSGVRRNDCQEASRHARSGRGHAFIPLSGLGRAMVNSAESRPCATILTQGAGDKPLTRFRHYHENSTSDLRHSRESSPPRGGTASIFVARTLDSGVRRNDW